MTSLESEKVILESDNGALLLTSHRTRHEITRRGRVQFKSIMLEEIASSSLTRSSNPLLLYIAAILGIVFLLSFNSSSPDDTTIGTISLIAGLILCLAYYLTSSQVLEITSAGTSIKINAKGLELENAKAFIDALEQAKNDRYLQGRGQ